MYSFCGGMDGNVRAAEEFWRIREHGMLTIVSVTIRKMVVNLVILEL